MNLTRVICPNCNKRFLPRKLVDHLKYQCGDLAQRTYKQNKTDRGRNNTQGGRRKGQSQATMQKGADTALQSHSPKLEFQRHIHFRLRDNQKMKHHISTEFI